MQAAQLEVKYMISKGAIKYVLKGNLGILYRAGLLSCGSGGSRSREIRVDRNAGRWTRWMAQLKRKKAHLIRDSSGA